MKKIGEEYLKRRNEEKGFVLVVGLIVMAVLLLLFG